MECFIPCNVSLVASNSPTLWTHSCPILWRLYSAEEYSQRLFRPNRKPSGRGRLRQSFSGCLGTFADLSQGPVLVKAGLGIQHGPSSTHPGTVEAAGNCGLLIIPNKLRRASHRQHLLLVCSTVLPKRPRTNTPSGQYINI